MNENGDTETSFGFRTVKTDEKARLVRGVFDSVASKYDLMNDLMSGGIHRVWKAVLTDRIMPRPGEHLLDVAGGTGDVAASFLSRADTRPGADAKPRATATLCDINFEMLKAGTTRSDAATFGDRITRVTGDAETLPFTDGFADAYTIAFGIRNVTHIDAALRDAYRVLKPGGRFMCLEFSHPITETMQKIYDTYSFNVIPWLGERVANDRESYQYLVESIRRFPGQEAFAAKIKNAGFTRVKYENLSGGIAAIHSGWRV